MVRRSRQNGISKQNSAVARVYGYNKHSLQITMIVLIELILIYNVLPGN